jgi:oxygen-independent coproporphyrinogen-3 oxidase
VAIARSSERADRYLDALDREVAALAGAVTPGRPVVQLHLGGGTPNFLTPAQLRGLLAGLRGRFAFDPGAEIAVEIDPRRCGADHLDALAEVGVNRMSIGVQDLDPRVQAAINRVQPAAMVRSVVEGARRRGVGAINLDLIYGLPHQTPERFAATLDEVIAIAPERIALFNFAYLPEAFAHQRAIDPAALPDPETKLTLLELSIARLTAAGWVFVGMDHFARPDDELVRALGEGRLSRSFQGYTTRGDVDLVGCGASAISSISSISSIGGAGGDGLSGYAQNLRGVDDYQAAAGSGGLATCRGLVLDAEDRLRREAIFALMARFRLDKPEIERRFAIDFDRHFARELEALAPLAADGLVELAGDRIEVTPLGRLLVRNVAAGFDAFLDERRDRGERPVRYSRAV